MANDIKYMNVYYDNGENDIDSIRTYYIFLTNSPVTENFYPLVMSKRIPRGSFICITNYVINKLAYLGRNDIEINTLDPELLKLSFNHYDDGILILTIVHEALHRCIPDYVPIPGYPFNII
jgi:hypothetical protein